MFWAPFWVQGLLPKVAKGHKQLRQRRKKARKARKAGRKSARR